jgi:DNA-binding transcriptional regulator YhcF (GntR family)
MAKSSDGGAREGRSGRHSASTFPNRFIPLYYQLENILRSKIEGGEVMPNHKLPTEQELSREYKISRATVRQALAALVSEGLLFRKQGKGTFVTEKASQTKSVKLTGFTEDLFSEGHQAEVKIMEVRRVPVPSGGFVLRVRREKRDPLQAASLVDGTRALCPELHGTGDRRSEDLQNHRPFARRKQISANDPPRDGVHQGETSSRLAWASRVRPDALHGDGRLFGGRAGRGSGGLFFARTDTNL